MNSEKFRVCVIFAGGKSSRMGEDKSLLPFGTFSSLAEYQYNRLSKLFDMVYISSKSNKFDFDANIILDSYNDSSPLVGLVSIFERFDIYEVFILSVDAPFVDYTIIERIYYDALLSKDIIVAFSPNGIEPLCGIYRKSILPKAREFLDNNNHKLQDLLKELNTQKVYFSQKDAFANLNYPNEYQKALKKI